MQKLLQNHALERSKFWVVSISFFNGKNGYGALVGLTFVKGTNVEQHFSFWGKKLENVVSGTCRFYVCKRYKCAEKGCETKRKREGTVPDLLEPFLIKND